MVFSALLQGCKTRNTTCRREISLARSEGPVIIIGEATIFISPEKP